ncbi:potassium channel family protein [Arcanobacterium hippocoleae]|uniref:Trk system potassium uptake protein TrkA n=1 Tax=Arcanobacterium hippocoleae TaxID=149017 RepID=A0ABU1T1V3_9ACTO|nr:TrkA family potassium uptake protein [Arcanobacterium hippocoleae]MDR6938851.1 trk system potassium uptake protein TrkA [Arcanobacterium hippocoleae]
MKVMIAGAGSVGRSIAQELIQRKYSITLIDSDPHAMRIARVPKANWVLADACEVATLKDIGLENFDVVVAATGDDKVNLVLGLLAKTEFGVPRVVGRVNNPSNEWLFNDSWGIDFAVSTPKIMTMVIDEAVASGELIKTSEFDNGQCALYQAVVSPDSITIGNRLVDLRLPEPFFISAIVREGVPLPAQGAIQLVAQDRLIIMGYQASKAEMDEVTRLFGPAQTELENSPVASA